MVLCHSNTLEILKLFAKHIHQEFIWHSFIFVICIFYMQIFKVPNKVSSTVASKMARKVASKVASKLARKWQSKYQAKWQAKCLAKWQEKG